MVILTSKLLVFTRKIKVKRSRRKPRKGLSQQPKRQEGFHCTWCRNANPYNERFVPAYYRPADGHRVDPLMCFSCYLERIGDDGMLHLGKRAPRLTVETLEAFWSEDVSDQPAMQAAIEYFRVKEETLIPVFLKVKKRAMV